MGFVGGGGNIAFTSALPPLSVCALHCKHQTVYGISLSYFLRFGFWTYELNLARGILFLLSAE